MTKSEKLALQVLQDEIIVAGMPLFEKAEDAKDLDEFWIMQSEEGDRMEASMPLEDFLLSYNGKLLDEIKTRIKQLVEFDNVDTLVEVVKAIGEAMQND